MKRGGRAQTMTPKRRWRTFVVLQTNDLRVKAEFLCDIAQDKEVLTEEQLEVLKDLREAFK